MILLFDADEPALPVRYPTVGAAVQAEMADLLEFCRE